MTGRSLDTVASQRPRSHRASGWWTVAPFVTWTLVRRGVVPLGRSHGPAPATRPLVRRWSSLRAGDVPRTAGRPTRP